MGRNLFRDTRAPLRHDLSSALFSSLHRWVKKFKRLFSLGILVASTFYITKTFLLLGFKCFDSFCSGSPTVFKFDIRLHLFFNCYVFRYSINLRLIWMHILFLLYVLLHNRLLCSTSNNTLRCGSYCWKTNNIAQDVRDLI
jgi:hypothetical protein